MVRVFIAVGSNIEPEAHVPRALELLDEAVGVEAVSTVLVTPAIDRPEQPDYWNCVARLRADDASGPEAFARDVLSPIESALGRVRTADAWAPRTMDLDVIAWGDRIVSEDVTRRDFLRRGLSQLGGPVPDDADRGQPAYPEASWQWSG